MVICIFRCHIAVSFAGNKNILIAVSVCSFFELFIRHNFAVAVDNFKSYGLVFRNKVKFFAFARKNCNFIGIAVSVCAYSYLKNSFFISGNIQCYLTGCFSSVYSNGIAVIKRNCIYFYCCNVIYNFVGIFIYVSVKFFGCDLVNAILVFNGN